MKTCDIKDTEGFQGKLEEGKWLPLALTEKFAETRCLL
jgi:hypothetical protein